MNLFLDADLNTKQTLLDSLGVAICLAEKQGEDIVIVAMNDLYRRYYGLSPETRSYRVDIEGLGSASGLSAKEVEPIVQRMRTNALLCFASKQTLNTENAMPHSDGSEKWARNTLAPIMRGDDVAYLLVSSVDITAIIETQREIENNLTRLIGQHVRVCNSCTRIESEKGDWLFPESYMALRGHTNFSHGICPTCKEGFR